MLYKNYLETICSYNLIFLVQRQEKYENKKTLNPDFGWPLLFRLVNTSV